MKRTGDAGAPNIDQYYSSLGGASMDSSLQNSARSEGVDSDDEGLERYAQLVHELSCRARAVFTSTQSSCSASLTRSSKHSFFRCRCRRPL